MSLDVSLSRMETVEVFTRNITHNLGDMAEAAGIYKALWRPEEIGITKASQLIPILEEGLNLLEAKPETFKQYNPKNGWGDYDGLVNFTTSYLEACINNPDADIEVDR